MKPIYQAQVISSGGREGRVRSFDGLLDLRVTPPKELGGAGGHTNPEQLFGAGYAACFESALNHVARLKKVAPGATSVVATVGIGKNDQGGFSLSVKLEISLPAMSKGDGESLIEAAHQVCPYSNATRGNIPVELALVQHAN